MNPFERRTAIGLALGWTDVKVTRWGCGDMPVGKFAGVIGALPPYESDLNATHEAEKTLTDEQSDEYAHQLGRICGAKIGASPFILIHATATQRAEALLRTIGK